MKKRITKASILLVCILVASSCFMANNTTIVEAKANKSVVKKVKGYWVNKNYSKVMMITGNKYVVKKLVFNGWDYSTKTTKNEKVKKFKTDKIGFVYFCVVKTNKNSYCFNIKNNKKIQKSYKETWNRTSKAVYKNPNLLFGD